MMKESSVKTYKAQIQNIFNNINTSFDIFNNFNAAMAINFEKEIKNKIMSDVDLIIKD